MNFKRIKRNFVVKEEGKREFKQKCKSGSFWPLVLTLDRRFGVFVLEEKKSSTKMCFRMGCDWSFDKNLSRKKKEKKL